MSQFKVRPEVVAAEAAAGATDEELAQKHGLSPKQIQHLRLRGGFKRPTPQSRPHPMRERAFALDAESWPSTEIAIETGIARDTLSQWRLPNAWRNGQDWRAVMVWANRHHPQLFQDIQRMEIE